MQQAMLAAITGVAPVDDERLAIYQRAYRARLIGTLRAMFPSLLETMGEELFHHFAIDFILRDPPQGWTLERLAETFPKYLAETKPDEPWAERLVEIAQRDAMRRSGLR